LKSTLFHGESPLLFLFSFVVKTYFDSEKEIPFLLH